jgi:hypothetical protein
LFAADGIAALLVKETSGRRTAQLSSRVKTLRAAMQGNMKIFALAGAAWLASGTLALAPAAASAAVQSATADSKTLKVDAATKKKKKAKPTAHPRQSLQNAVQKFAVMSK